MKALRVIEDPALPGDLNMAIDQTLLDLAGEGSDAQPVLRFYSWQPATLSLGYFQTLASRQSHAASSTLDVVRRTTGGGAIIHDHELTYSLTLPLTDRWAAEHRLLYDNMHLAIIAVLGEFGVRAELFASPSESNRPEKPADFLCFMRRAPGDIVLDGQKICGSAQRRSATALLQHGSILLDRSEYAPELPGIRTLAGTGMEPKNLVSGIIAELSAKLGMVPENTGPSDPDCKTTANWRSTRFGNAGWTGKR